SCHPTHRNRCGCPALRPDIPCARGTPCRHAWPDAARHPRRTTRPDRCRDTPQVLASRYPSSSFPWLSPPRSLFPSFAAGTDPHPGWFHEPPLWVTLLPPEPSILITMRKTDGMLKLAGLCVLAGILVAGLLFPVV